MICCRDNTAVIKRHELPHEEIGAAAFFSVEYFCALKD